MLFMLATAWFVVVWDEVLCDESAAFGWIGVRLLTLEDAVVVVPGAGFFLGRPRGLLPSFEDELPWRGTFAVTRAVAVAGAVDVAGAFAVVGAVVVATWAVLFAATRPELLGALSGPAGTFVFLAGGC